MHLSFWVEKTVHLMCLHAVMAFGFSLQIPLGLVSLLFIVLVYIHIILFLIM